MEQIGAGTPPRVPCGAEDIERASVPMSWAVTVGIARLIRTSTISPAKTKRWSLANQDRGDPSRLLGFSVRLAAGEKQAGCHNSQNAQGDPHGSLPDHALVLNLGRAFGNTNPIP